jgi:hypothetical protein
MVLRFSVIIFLLFFFLSQGNGKNYYKMIVQYTESVIFNIILETQYDAWIYH